MDKINPDRKPPEILKTEVCAQSRLFTVESMDLRFSNGVEQQWERLKGSTHGAVLVVPMLDTDTVLLIREYAAGVERYELALPKGKIDPGETMLEAANREMMEEVGYGANRLTHIDSVTIAPGYLSHTTHIVLGEDLYEESLTGDEPEEIEVVPWKLSNLGTLLAHEEMTEARSIAALFMVRERLQR